MNKGIRRHLAAEGPRHEDRSRRVSVQAGKARHHGRRLLRFAAAFAGAVLALTAAPAVPGYDGTASAQRLVLLSSAKRLDTVTVSVGKAEDVRLDAGFSDVVIGDAEIADIHPITDKALSILGKKLGTTRVSVYGEGKRLIGVFDVEVAYDTTLLQDELKRRFPAAKLKVTAVNGRIMLTGSAPDGVVLDKAVTIAKQFGPEVINSVSVDAPQQVMLEVRFVEASRQAGRELGLQWNITPRSGHAQRFLTNMGNNRYDLPVTSGTSGSVLDTAAAGVLGSSTAPFGYIAANLIAKGLNIDVMVNALEEKGLARKLAEPNLVALSGDTASFLAGGEYPIPVASDYNKITVDYKRYGVSLAFTPTVLSSGLINMKIEPEVSQIDPAHSVVVSGGISIPALIVRRASTTVELRDGQSFVLAGLLQNDTQTVQQQFPWIGDIPVLGALFSSKAYQKQETDLVIIVTPRLARPARPGDPLVTPLDNTLPANDVDFFVNGKPELRRADVRATEGPAERPFTGHMLSFTKGGSHAALR
jgi:pilus assembly protein CpaC